MASQNDTKIVLAYFVFGLMSLGGLGCASKAKSLNEPLPALAPVSRSFGDDEQVHVLNANESLWFIANIYYQDPTRYKEILEYNGLSSVKQVHVGHKLKIPDPFHSQSDDQFTSRYSRLFMKRAEKLALKRKENQSVKRETASKKESKKPKK